MSIKKKVLLFILSISLFQCAQNDPYKQGKELYQLNCSSCHMDDGTGLGALIPPLAQSDFYQKNNKQVACMIRNGLSDTIIVNGILYGEAMEGYKKMTPVSMVNIINYINNSWGNNIPSITLKEVKTALNSCSDNR